MSKNIFSKIALGILTAGIFIFTSATHASPILSYNFNTASSSVINEGSLGSSYSGTLSGNPEYVASDTGNALSFDGNADFVIPNGPNDAFNFGNDPFSVFIRFSTENMESNESSIRALLWKESTGPEPGWTIGVVRGSGLLTFGIADGSSWSSVYSTMAVRMMILLAQLMKLEFITQPKPQSQSLEQSGFLA